MTFYEELQLSSTGSKALIKNTTDPKEKRRHILIYNFKVYLVMAFCFVFVTLFSMLFGSDNSVAGVVFLLALLVLRQADFVRLRFVPTAHRNSLPIIVGDSSRVYLSVGESRKRNSLKS